MTDQGSLEGHDGEDDGRSAMAKAMDLVSRITSISLTFVIPILAGYYVDQWFETRIVFLLLGFAFGLFVAGLQLLKLVSSLQDK